MKVLIFRLCLVLFLYLIQFELIAQSTISLPGVYLTMFNNCPKSNSDISFRLPHPFIQFQDSIPNEKTTYQYLISLPKLSDSLLNECIKYALLSLSFEKQYSNFQNGVEIWSGEIDGFFSVSPSIIGVYWTNDSTTTKVYVLTSFWLFNGNRKSKTNTSQYICESIKFILGKTLK